MDADLVVPAPSKPQVATPRLESAAYAALVERKRAEFAHLAPQYELQFQVATMGRMREVWRQVASLAVGGAKGPALELCCGTGGVTAELARRFDDVTGVDLSPDMMARAARRLERERLTHVRLREAEISTLQFPPASFAAVVISLGLHELPISIRNHVLERAAVWLKPGGRFVFCDYVQPRNRLVGAFLRWIGRLVIEEEHFDEFMDYSMEEHLQRHGFRLVERRRRFLSCLEVSAWTVVPQEHRSPGALETGRTKAAPPRRPALVALPRPPEEPTSSRTPSLALPAAAASSLAVAGAGRLRWSDPAALRPLRAAELTAMTHVLAEAFMSDPLYEALAPAPRTRERWLRWVMALSLRASHRQEGAFCLDAAPEAGGICLVPPDRGRLSLLDLARAAPGLPPLGRGLSAWLGPGLAMKQLLHEARFPEPHLYVLAVGVAPTEQGKGLGGALVRAALSMAAERGLPCYLETASPRNVALYQHLGFRVERELAPRGLPPIWTMLRPPPPPPEPADPAKTGAE